MGVQNSTFAATVGGAVTIVIVWALQTWTTLSIPPEVASAFTTIIMAVLTHLVPDKAAGPAPAGA
jgi:hypothetical protein